MSLGAVALVLPGLCPSLAMRGDPRWLVPLGTMALTLGLASIAAGLALSTAVGVLHLVERASLAQYEGHLAPGGIVASALAASALAVLGGRIILIGRRARRGRCAARADRWLGHHRDFGDHVLVLLPTTVPIAYSVAGSPPQIVISQGLRDRLESDLFAFLIDHERAHLSSKHSRTLVIAACSAALFGRLPAVSRSTLVLGLAVERAADEKAAGRDPLRRRRLAIAMSRLGDAHWLPHGADESLRFRAGQLVALPTPMSRWLQIGATTGLGALSILVTAVTGHVGDDLPGLIAALR